MTNENLTPGEVRTFRKKPVDVEAMQYDGTVGTATPIIEWAAQQGVTITYYCENSEECREDTHRLKIPTLEGDMFASPGDWVLKGVQNEFYPCKPDIFADTYGEADEEWAAEGPQLRGQVQLYQFTADDPLALTHLTLPTGPVTVQEENPITKAQLRAYVPTAFGTHILDLGDWVLVHESGVVLTLPDAAISEITDRPAQRASSEAVLYRTKSFTAVDAMQLTALIEQQGLDWELLTESSTAAIDYFLRQSATGNLIENWVEGQAVTVFLDRVEVK